jgi:hypothetical protein
VRRSGVRTLWDLFLRLAFLAALGVVAWYVVDAYVPSRHLPWKPVDLTQPAGLATHMQIEELASNRDACILALQGAGVEVEPAEDIDGAEPFCQVRNAVRIKSGVTALSPGDLVMSCPLVAAYVVWDRQVLQPAAQETLRSPVTGLVSYGTYSCRRMTGGADSNPSEHARANALDVGEFKLADGRRITVLEGWPAAGPEAEFLRRVREGGCQVFRTVLGPDYNAAHANHLHLDMGPSDYCPHGPATVPPAAPSDSLPPLASTPPAKRDAAPADSI